MPPLGCWYEALPPELLLIKNIENFAMRTTKFGILGAKVTDFVTPASVKR